jgi:hypothetical protein
MAQASRLIHIFFGSGPKPWGRARLRSEFLLFSGERWRHSFDSPYNRRTMTAGENSDLLNAFKLNWKTYTGIFLVSVIYFADISLKASRKCFWFDELIATYLCRLHDFNSTWQAVLHGADFIPPLLYSFTRCAQWLVGGGLIATRLPPMSCVWLFGVSLFLFVSRDAGVFPGLVAGTFPFFNLAQYYAYEARAHGILMVWSGPGLLAEAPRTPGAKLLAGCLRTLSRWCFADPRVRRLYFGPVWPGGALQTIPARKA